MLYSHVREDGHASFYFPGEHHHSVSVTGSFCGWQTPGVGMRRVQGGWAADVGSVPHGDLAYKFIADGRWVVDPVNLTRENPHPEANSLLHRGHDRGAIYQLSFHAPALGSSRNYVIYLPAGYAAGGRRHPVLYLLHGVLDYERTWLDKGSLVPTIERLQAQAAIGDLIVVMPFENGDLFRGDGRIVDYLARDVVGHIDHEFATLATQRHRAIDGLSTGGFTSLVMGAWRPRVFRSVGSMSGSYDGRAFDAARTCSIAMREADQRYLVSAGLDEPHLEDCRSLARELSQANVFTTWLDARGGHDWPLWRDLLAGHLRHHWRHIGR